MIYFVQDSHTLAIKIGYSADSAVRLKALQTGNASALVLLFEMPGKQSLETELHHRFTKERVAGEWFRPAPELLQYILEQNRKWDTDADDSDDYDDDWDDEEDVEDDYDGEDEDDCDHLNGSCPHDPETTDPFDWDCAFVSYASTRQTYAHKTGMAS